MRFKSLKINTYRYLLLFLLLIFYLPSFSQSVLNNGELHGDFHIDSQYYTKDSDIGATDVPEKVLLNGYANLLYRNGGFSAGIRYENYLDPLLGYDPRYKGNGIPYKFISYSNKQLTIIAGNFYEQFGSGMIFRSYEDKDLGYDNVMNGFSIRFTPLNGITLKGIIGKQRSFWSEGEGIIRGADAELNLNDLLKTGSSNLNTIIGGSVVSKFQEDKSTVYKIPGNVAAFGARLNLTYKKLHFEGEYVYKYNDPYPSSFPEYNYIYKPGEALLLTGSYNRKGLGIMLSAKRTDNMNFRSDISATGNSLMINYMPALTVQHEYALQNFFPYSTQVNGEMGMQAQINYKIKKGSHIGGAFGTDLMLNYSRIQSIDKDILPANTHLGYKSDFLSVGKDVYYEDISLKLNRKLNKKIKAALAYSHVTFNNDVITGMTINGVEWKGSIYSDIVIAEMTYKLTDRKALRIELEHLYSQQYKKNWAMALIEYSVSPHWSVSVFDEYNYGNPDAKMQLHYYNASFNYVKGGSSIQLMYGRRVEGIICVGGVCRYMPSANGFTLVFNTTF